MWDAEKCEFTKVRGLDAGVLTSTLHLLPALSTSEQAMRRGVYGSNEIIIPTKSFLTLVGLEVLNPFYVFQILSFFLWICDNYVYYALVIISMASCGIIMSAVQTQRVSFQTSLSLSSFYQKNFVCEHVFFENFFSNTQ